MLIPSIGSMTTFMLHGSCWPSRIFCLLRIHTGLAEILEALREYLGTADALHHDFRAAALYDNRITEVDASRSKMLNSRAFSGVYATHMTSVKQAISLGRPPGIL
mgnify:CR=1 FL=1